MAHQLLLADDSVTIQRVIKLTFADEDVDVVAVGDGNQAVASIDRQPPDIVLADIAMPGRTGYEVAQHIRTSPNLAHIPVLLLTGAFEPVDEARASEVGCDGVLAKPFEPELVVSRVKELLARPRAAAPRPAAPAPAGVPGPAPAAPGEEPPSPGLMTATAVSEPEPAPVPPAPLVFPVKSVAPPAPVPVEMPSRQSAADVDAYFERLDQAFATLALSPRPAPPALPDVADMALSASTPVEVPLPLAPEPPSPAAVALMDAFAGLAAPEPLAPVADSPAFSAATTRAAATADAAHREPGALTDAEVDRIVARVLDRLTVRLGVGLPDVVANVAERVVKDEIARIKRRV